MNLISIIIPAYNAEKSIDRCIQSVLCQDFKFFELIIVNDGSQDHTPELIRKAAAKDSRITLINQENKGEMAARASGIRKARGEWLYFLDSDDAILPDTLSSISSHIADDIDVIIYEFPINGKLSRRQYYCELLSFNSWWLCGKLWRRELFDDYAMSVPRYFRTGGDMLTQMRLLRNVTRLILGVPEHKYIYDENNPMSVRRTTYKNYEYEKKMVLEVENALETVDENITDIMRHWQLVYLSGMMGLRYNIIYTDSWIVELKKWSLTANLSYREKLAIKAIDRPLFRNFFVVEKSAKRTVRAFIDTIKRIARK